MCYPMGVTDCGDANSRFLVFVAQHDHKGQTGIETVLSLKASVNDVKHIAYMRSILA